MTIGNLVSPCSCLSPERAAADWRAPNERPVPFSAAWEIRAVEPGAAVSLVPRATQDVYSYVDRQLTNALTF